MSYGEKPVLHGIELSIVSSQLLAIAGPNGAGKSTLLSILAGLRRQYTGSCLLHGREIREVPRRECARTIAVVPQSLQMEFPFTAEQVVFMGRTPHGDGLFDSDLDYTAVENALQLTDTAQFRSRDFRSLSGGERQRVILASALAQSPQVLLLDEPTTYLDPEHQIALFRILRGLVTQGLLVISISHDLNLVSVYADRVILMHQGEIRAFGATAEVLTPKPLTEVFSIQTQIFEQAGRRWIQYGP